MVSILGLEKVNTFALQTSNNNFMVSSEDFQRVYELYKQQGVLNSISHRQVLPETWHCVLPF